MEFKRISNYDINIIHTANGGMIVRVGCATLSFSNPEDMMDVMKQYYEDPEGMEKQYYAGSGGPIIEPDGPRPDSRAGMISGGNVLERHPRTRNEEPMDSGPNTERRG